jgi:hypothetical protein
MTPSRKDDMALNIKKEPSEELKKKPKKENVV